MSGKPAGSGVGDARVRAAAFCRTLAIIAAIVGAGHWLESRERYSLAEADHIVHGGYGLSLTRIPPKDEGTFRVLMLGNSVYQRSQVGTNFRRLAREQGRPIEFINLAMTAAGINDYPFMLAWALAQEPDADAVLIGVGSFTFSDLGFTFNTDADSVAFHPRVRAIVPAAQYERRFGVIDGIESAIGVVSPLRRLDTVLHHRAHTAAAERLASAGVDVSWLTSRLPLPRLNLVVNRFDAERRRGQVPEGAAWLNRPFWDDAGQTFGELLGIAEAAGLPVLVIRQECRLYPISPGADELVRREVGLVSGVPVAYVDREHLWDEADFVDQIHPAREHLGPYAAAHFDELIAFIESIGLGSRIRPSPGS